MGSLRRLGLLLDIEGSLDVCTRPSDFLALVLHPTDTAAHGIIIHRVDQSFRVVHQFQLLDTLFLHRAEILLMSGSQAGQHTYRRLYDVVQRHHLPRLTDASLKDTHLRLLVQQPYRQRYANLRIVATGRTHYLLRRQQ